MGKNQETDTRWRFTMFHDSNELDGAHITGYVWNFDDGTAELRTGPEENSITHDVGPAGLTVKGRIDSDIGPSEQIGNFCTAAVGPTAGQGQVLSTTATPMPATGPEAALGGMAGLTAIAVASRAYARSRKSLLGSLRRKP
jgi:hypothetical protein